MYSARLGYDKAVERINRLVENEHLKFEINKLKDKIMELEQIIKMKKQKTLFQYIK